MFGFGKGKKPTLQGVKDVFASPDGKVHKRIGEHLGLDLHSADEGARIFAYEGVGRILTNKVPDWPSRVLAAATAMLAEPGTTDVVSHLSNRIAPADIDAAARFLRTALAEIRVEYFPPKEERGPWSIRTDCIMRDDPNSRLSTHRPLDWSSLPDVVRDAYLKGAQETYKIQIYPVTLQDIDNA